MATSAVAGEDVADAELRRCQAVCLTNRAAALKMLNRLPQAIRDCRSAMARDRGHTKAYIRAAKYHLQRAETEQARGCLDELAADSLTTEDQAEIAGIEHEMGEIRAGIGKMDQVSAAQDVSRVSLVARHRSLRATAVRTQLIAAGDGPGAASMLARSPLAPLCGVNCPRLRAGRLVLLALVVACCRG